MPAPPAPDTPRARPLLTAQWSDLILLSFTVPDGLLRPRLPDGLELDRWNGTAQVTLVALDFRETRVLGIRVPGLAAFPVLNLRTYVRWRHTLGVLFLRQFVRSAPVAHAARLLAGQPYRTIAHVSRAADVDDRRTAVHHFGPRVLRYHLSAVGSAASAVPGADSLAHHLAERHWGFGVDRRGRLYRFGLTRPPWAVREHTTVDYQIDFAKLWGEEWKILNGSPPAAALFAVGSSVTVYGRERLTG